MIRSTLKNVLLLSSVLPIRFSEDEVVRATETEKKVDLTQINETGWDRLHRMFSTDEFGNMSHELNMVTEVACVSLFAGGMYGGFIHSRRAYLDFIQNNQATAFNDHLEAKKRLQDKVTLGMARGGFKWGWRLSLFCTTFVGVATVISEYRGKNGIIEYMIGGAAAGTLYKFSMGPKGWIAGGTAGMVLGTIAGSAIYGLLKLGGMTMQDARYWQYNWQSTRAEMFRKAVDDHVKQEELEILKDHDKKMGTAGTKLEEIDIDVKETENKINK